jgi:predicted O-methyltransferase YrrM
MLKSVYIIMGAPRSGIKVFSQCLNILGVKPLIHESAADTSTINHFLLQDLGITPFTPAMPRGWLESEAVNKAKERIEKLISANLSFLQKGILKNDEIDSSESSLKSKAHNFKHTTYIADPLLSRTLPLWHQVLQDNGIKNRCLHIIRQPWEVAMSLKKNDGLDFQNAHIVWLSHIRDVLRNCPDQIIVTFDQLLADPVSTINHALSSLQAPDLRLPSETTPTEFPQGLHWRQLIKNSLALLDYVQPSLKHHQTRDLPEPDKEAFIPYAKLYDQLRSAQHSSSAQLSENQRIKDLGSSEIDLIDTLLQALSHGSSQITTALEWQAHNYPQLTDTDSSLYAKITFPSSRHEPGVTHTIPLLEGQWQKITLSVPEPESLGNSPIKLMPLNTNGIVMISHISLVNQANEAIVWSLEKTALYTKLSVSGTSFSLPGQDNFLALVTGNNSSISFFCDINLSDIPLSIHLWIKSSREQDIIRKYSAPALKDESQSLLAQPISNFSYLNGLKIPQDEEAIVEYIVKHRNKFNDRQLFEVYSEIAKHHIVTKNFIRAIHYFEKIKKTCKLIPDEYITLGQYYLAVNRPDYAYENYSIGFVEKFFYDERLKKRMRIQFDNYKKATENARKVREHGHKMLLDYLADNLEYIKQQSQRKLSLIEVGSTREEHPDQGSTRKLADFCHEHGLDFITVDMDPHNTMLAQDELSRIDDSFQAINQKGEDFFKEYTGHIDFVFLDAYDCDHGKHSDQRQEKYQKYIGEKISNEASYRMHLDCVKEIRKKIAPWGAICIDDTFFKEDTWHGKGAYAVPYLLDHSYCVTCTGNNGILMVQDKSNKPIDLINDLSVHLDYCKRDEVNALIQIINNNITGRVCVTDYLHGLYLIKKYMGDECRVYVETGSLFGGSLSLVMQDKTPCYFVGIDPFNGYYDKACDPKTKLPVNLETTTSNIDKMNVHKHEYALIKGSSYDLATVEKFRKLGKKIDLFFVDGDHSYEGVIKDYEAYKEFMSPGGFIVFENYGQPNLFEGVKKAVWDINFEDDGFERIGQYGFSYIVKK